MIHFFVKHGLPGNTAQPAAPYCKQHLSLTCIAAFSQHALVFKCA